MYTRHWPEYIFFIFQNKLKVEEEEEKINDKSDEVEKGRMSGGQQNVGMVAEVVEVQQKPAPTPAPIPAPTDKTTKLLEPCDRTLAKLNDLKQRLNLLRDDTELASLDNRINKLMGVFNENKLAIKNLREEYSSNIPV